MRKVTFVIDDIEFFKKEYAGKLSKKDFMEIFKNTNSFQAIYTLIGKENSKTPDRYELTDLDGNKMQLNELNDYQKCVVLADCWTYYTGEHYFSGTQKPYGVIKITEEKIM